MILKLKGNAVNLHEWNSNINLGKVVLVSILALTVAGCQHGKDTKSRGFMIGSHPAEHHPVVVMKKPVKMKLPVSRGDYELGQPQAFMLKQYLHKFKSNGSGKIRVAAPTGTPNEVAAFNVMENVRSVINEENIPRHVVEFMPYTPSDPEAPIKFSYLGHVAEAPQCGDWSENMFETPSHRSYKNYGCAVQANFAAMIANPKDLLEPRASSPRNSQRRDVTMENYVLGKDTTSKESSKQTSTKVKDE